MNLTQEGLQGGAAFEQSRLVADGAGHLHRKAEVVRHRRRPAGVGSGLMGAVERRIDFHTVEYLRVSLQVTAVVRESRRASLRDSPSGATEVEPRLGLRLHAGPRWR